MPRRTTYIVVEGPHDTAFVGKLLREGALHLEPVSVLAAVDDFWTKLIPRTYPPKNPRTNDEEFKRVRMPDFFQNATHSVAVEWAEGYDQVATVLTDSLALLPAQPDGLGLVVDADKATANNVFADVVSEVSTLRPGLSLGTGPGLLVAGPPRAGVFVMPDNANTGTLEDLLLDCAGTAYPMLKPLAEGYVTSVANTPATVPAGEDREFKKPAGQKKAVVSAISSILKPGKAVPNTIRDNSWIQPSTLALPKVQGMADFITNLVR
jgi:hypothetical protein